MHNGMFELRVKAEYQKTRCLDGKFNIDVGNRTICIFSGEQDYDITVPDGKTLLMCLDMLWTFTRLYQENETIGFELTQFFEYYTENKLRALSVDQPPYK